MLSVMVSTILFSQREEANEEAGKMFEEGIYCNFQFDFDTAYDILSQVDSTNSNIEIFALSQMHLAHTLLWLFRFDDFTKTKASLVKYLERHGRNDLWDRVAVLESIELAHRRRFLPALTNLSAHLKEGNKQTRDSTKCYNS